MRKRNIGTAAMVASNGPHETASLRQAGAFSRRLSNGGLLPTDTITSSKEPRHEGGRWASDARLWVMASALKLKLKICFELIL
jgi:hypothetical protein